MPPQGGRGGMPMAQLGRDDVQDLYPEDVAKGLTEGKMLLVDVREPNETELERYPDPAAVYMPMSEFDLACRSGNRSVTASLIAQTAGLPYNKHLAGGIKGWKEAGLPTDY
jgi:rhodanese-related sulfurtransferase